MLRASRALCGLQSGVNIGRAALAQQFSSMDGWQSAQDDRFDAYVAEKRRRERHDAFDQRVERAFRAAAALHKSEVANAFKRRLTSQKAKFTAETMIEMRAAVEDRLGWLREVWSQVDADYRSGEPAREAAAAREIAAALRGEPGDYMRWVYETKHEERFMGPKQKEALEAELENAALPAVSDDEVNRYHSLAIDMLDIERRVKSKYGVAGQQHWAELQDAKDAVYEKKLDRAAAIYQELLQQNDNYEESRRTALLRSNVERVHQAQVRFKAAMEMENERERMVEAHRAMEEARKNAAKEQRVALLKEAAEMKASGASTAEVQAALRERQLGEHARRQAEHQLQEQEAIRARKATYLDMIEEFKYTVEEAEGRELMRGGGGGGEITPQRQRDSGSGRRVNAFGFADEDRLDDGVSSSSAWASPPAVMGGRADGTAAASDYSRREGEEGEDAAVAAGQQQRRQRSPHEASKRDLWRHIAADNYEDPFHTIHQARLDAERNYDPSYAKFFPMNTVQGRKYSRQGMGEFAVGNATDNQIMQKANMNVQSFSWGVSPQTAFDLDGDGNTDYYFNDTWHVRDKETGDIDFRYERRKGGAVFRGPRLYKMGAAREAADPGAQTVDPMPYQSARSLPRNLRRMPPTPPSPPSSSSSATRLSQPKERGAAPQQQRRAVRLQRFDSAAASSSSSSNDNSNNHHHRIDSSAQQRQRGGGGSDGSPALSWRSG